MNFRSGRIAILLTFALAVGYGLTFSQAARGQASAQTPPESKDDAGLKIANKELADAYPRVAYREIFVARGNYVPTVHWRVEKGTLPPGIVLDDNGELRGLPQGAGEYLFTVSVTDSGKPQQAIQKQFLLKVVEAMTLEWKAPAHVAGGRIEGSAEITNTTADDIDLTFIVMAVAENGRATAIGYQRFPLRTGTIKMELPFGENLPRGAYVVHVDAVGEVAKKKAIYRERMQTPTPLQVAVGP
jgi:Putative Ig domain